MPFLLWVPSAVPADFCLPGFGPQIQVDPESSVQIQTDLIIWQSRDPNALYVYRRGQLHRQSVWDGRPLCGGMHSCDWKVTRLPAYHSTHSTFQNYRDGCHELGEPLQSDIWASPGRMPDINTSHAKRMAAARVL